LAFALTLAPVWVRDVDAPAMIRVTLPSTTGTLTLLTGALMMLPPCTVTVAVGMPLNTTLLAVEEDTVVPEPKVIVTATEPVPKVKSLVEVVIAAADVEMTLDPVSGPTIDTPYPADVMVDETTDRTVADAAPA